MKSAILKIIAIAAFICIVTRGQAYTQPPPDDNEISSKKPAAKPYRILTTGKRITVQSKTDINKVLVWTSKGQRFVEENNVNAPSYSFEITIREKFFFIMLELKNGKRYTEKIGIQ